MEAITKASVQAPLTAVYQGAQLSALSGVSRMTLLVAVKLSWISANATVLLFLHKFFFMIKTFRSVHGLDAPNLPLLHSCNTYSLLQQILVSL